jgi:hypothetical protein
MTRGHDGGAIGEHVGNRMDLPKSFTAPVGRLSAAAQNAFEVARFGGLTTDEQPSPYQVVGEHRIYRLRHYYPGVDDSGGPDTGPAVLLVPPMMLAAEIYDVSPATSAVTLLHENGVDPWVVDFGAPEREEGGLERTLADHVLAVSDAVDRVREATGRAATRRAGCSVTRWRPTGATMVSSRSSPSAAPWTRGWGCLSGSPRNWPPGWPA